MRVAILLLAMLLLAGWAACILPEPDGGATAASRDIDSWRRTVDGWELTDSWHPVHKATPPAPHPAVVGLLLTLLATTIGVATLPADRQEEHQASYAAGPNRDGP
ncbi:MAG: hypothetical protein U1E05_23690 [Patescibacteria group bacterium]|nr:hypothetical protein [Patescibacteria group bacterium]